MRFFSKLHVLTRVAFSPPGSWNAITVLWGHNNTQSNNFTDFFPHYNVDEGSGDIFLIHTAILQFQRGKKN